MTSPAERLTTKLEQLPISDDAPMVSLLRTTLLKHAQQGNDISAGRFSEGTQLTDDFDAGDGLAELLELDVLEQEESSSHPFVPDDALSAPLTLSICRPVGQAP
ncbi:hypothetical protein EU244_029765 [Rhodococcus qingshengii]|uniref:hypothetical protein n=1 Tax=Rhodococcus qingshengii TaxID=334542 RepID=UPI001455E8A0|nr:hypothetical protein [Rhodococcus qingshengii]